MAAPKPTEILRYPDADIHKTTDYFRITILDYTPNKLRRSGSGPSSVVSGVGTDQQSLANPGQGFTVPRSNRKSSLKVPLAVISLPIPSNIQDGNSVKYVEGNLDGLTAQALGIVVDSFKGNTSDPGRILYEALRGTANVISDPGAQDYFLRSLAVDAANLPFGGNLTASQLLARQTGNILNPNMELLFDGVTLRSFKFSFKMTPRNKGEAEQVKKIIRLLKTKMSPGFGQEGFNEQPSGITNLYLSTPKIFQLEYMKGSQPHPFLHKFKQCFLTDMSVNYTGEGTYATYGGSDADGGGTPVSMIMDLGFKELEPIYAGDYTNDVGGVGY